MKSQFTKAALAVALIASFGAAQADKGDNNSLLSSVSGDVQVSAASAQTRGTAAPGAGYDTAGTESWDGIGSPNNTVIELNIGEGNVVTGASFDVSIMTSGNGSWCSEATVLMSNSDGEADPNGILLSPAASVSSTCDAGQEFSSGGVIDFGDNSLPDIQPNADGILRLEFHESFDDVADDIDAFWGPHSAPAAVQGIGLACSNQQVCDIVASGGTVPGTYTVPTMNAFGIVTLSIMFMIAATVVFRVRSGH